MIKIKYCKVIGFNPVSTEKTKIKKKQFFHPRSGLTNG